MKTKAAVLRNVGSPLVIEELEIPKLEKGQILVKVLYSGLCRSNINEIYGYKGAEFIPHLTGHEASAVVVEVGKGVSKVLVGDYVVCSWIKGWGLETSPVKYKSDKDVVSAGACSTFSEFAVISENRLVKISRMIYPDVASLFGCAVPTGAGIIDNFGIKAGQKVAVFGIGGIGASALMRAVSCDIDCTAFDVVSWKLNWAQKNLNVKAINIFEFSLFNGFFDFVIECSGNKVAMEIAFELINNNGMAIIAGNLKPGERISIDPSNLVKGKKLQGTWGGGCFPDRDIPLYAELYLNGKLPIVKLITKVYSLDRINEGIEDLERGKLIRGIVKIG